MTETAFITNCIRCQSLMISCDTTPDDFLNVLGLKNQHFNNLSENNCVSAKYYDRTYKICYEIDSSRYDGGEICHWSDPNLLRKHLISIHNPSLFLPYH